LSAATSTVASVPVKGSLRSVPSHHEDGTGAKSPGGESPVSPLFGDDPGATSTRHV
jgi:hypothetical protein